VAVVDACIVRLAVVILLLNMLFGSMYQATRLLL
jgi:hypothetical protein